MRPTGSSRVDTVDTARAARTACTRSCSTSTTRISSPASRSRSAPRRRRGVAPPPSDARRAGRQTCCADLLIGGVSVVRRSRRGPGPSCRSWRSSPRSSPSTTSSRPAALPPLAQTHPRGRPDPHRGAQDMGDFLETGYLSAAQAGRGATPSRRTLRTTRHLYRKRRDLCPPARARVGAVGGCHGAALSSRPRGAGRPRARGEPRPAQGAAPAARTRSPQLRVPIALSFQPGRRTLKPAAPPPPPAPRRCARTRSRSSTPSASATPSCRRPRAPRPPAQCSPR